MFFQPKSKVITTVVPKAVYRDKKHPLTFIAVLGVSKPELKQSILDSCLFELIKIDRIHDKNGTIINNDMSVYALEDDKTGKTSYAHFKKDFSKSIVMYIDLDGVNHDLLHSDTIDHFDEQYELVIGYKADNTPFTESDVK